MSDTLDRVSDPDAIAAAWVKALTARGVTLQVWGRNLAYHPKSAYSAMSDDERATLKRHKAAIVALLASRYGGEARPEGGSKPEPDAVATASPPVVEPEPCRWCYRSPCVGREHPAFFALHPIEARRQDDDEATAVMMRQVGRPLPYWYR